jgi:hypothetical protein
MLRVVGGAEPGVSTYILVLILLLLLLLHAPSGGDPALELQPALHHVLVRLAHLARVIECALAPVSRGNVDRKTDIRSLSNDVWFQFQPSDRFGAKLLKTQTRPFERETERVPFAAFDRL